MSTLADACALLAYLGACAKTMTETGRAAMRSAPFVSPITIWEPTQKSRLGKLPPLATKAGSFTAHLLSIGFKIEPAQAIDAELATNLPPLHKDPMDRMLIGTAKRADHAIITCNPVFAQYGVPTLW